MSAGNGRRVPITILVGGAGIVSAGMVGAGGVHRHHARPRALPGIPARDYQTSAGPLPKPVVALSSAATPMGLGEPSSAPGAASMALLAGRNETAVRPRTKYYQFAPATLQVDHCMISRIAVTLQEDGAWRLNLQADQNPGGQEPAAATLPVTMSASQGSVAGITRHTLYVKRNLFIITVRGLGANSEPLPLAGAPGAQGKPVLLSLAPITFWVQRGIPRTLTLEGAHPDAQDFFDLIDRVEIEFTYR
jgi:hypothetical protein